MKSREMKHVKSFGLVVAAAMALVAFIGAGSASATVLCNESTTSGCTSYGKGAVIDASLTGSATFTTTGGTLLDTCTSGTVRGATSTAGGSSETVKESIEELTWESCSKTTDAINKGELEIHWVSGSDNGTVTGKNASVTVNSVFGSCTYGTGEALDLGTLKGGNPATIEINATVGKTAGSIACPSQVKWAASYSITSPQPLDVGESASVAAPLIRVTNNGGVPKFGSTTCEYSLQFEKCKLTVENNSAFPVTIINVEIAGTLGSTRYGIINAQCKKNSDIAENGGTCTDEVILNASPVAGWSNWYFIQVEEKGSKGKNTIAVNAYLKTI